MPVRLTISIKDKEHYKGQKSIFNLIPKKLYGEQATVTIKDIYFL